MQINKNFILSSQRLPTLSINPTSCCSVLSSNFTNPNPRAERIVDTMNVCTSIAEHPSRTPSVNQPDWGPNRWASVRVYEKSTKQKEICPHLKAAAVGKKIWFYSRFLGTLNATFWKKFTTVLCYMCFRMNAAYFGRDTWVAVTGNFRSCPEWTHIS